MNVDCETMNGMNVNAMNGMNPTNPNEAFMQRCRRGESERGRGAKSIQKADRVVDRGRGGH